MNNNTLIGIFPGRFQPAHRGHKMVYDKMKQLVGQENAYIATSDKVEANKSPLNFSEKQQIWARHGVPTEKIVKVTNPYKAEEITHKFDANTTSAVFFLSKKDAERIPFGVRKDGKPAYFKPYKGNENNLQPIAQHSYIYVVPTFSVDGKTISGTTVREGLGSVKYTDEQKKKFFQWVFGWFDLALFNLLVDKFTTHNGEISKAEPTLAEEYQMDMLHGAVRTIAQEVISASPEADIEDPQAVLDKQVKDDPELQRKEREANRAEKEMLRKKHTFQLKQKKYRLDAIEQDKRDIKATDAAIKDIK